MVTHQVVDIKTKAAFQYKLFILKRNFCFHVNGKFPQIPLQPIPELRPNQIPKHLPVSEASVKAGAPASCRCFGKKSRSFGKKSRSFGFLAEAPALPILPILENLAEAASADASAD